MSTVVASSPGSLDTRCRRWRCCLFRRLSLCCTMVWHRWQSSADARPQWVQHLRRERAAGGGQGWRCSPGRVLGPPFPQHQEQLFEKQRRILRDRTGRCAEVPVPAHPRAISCPLPLPCSERGNLRPGVGARGERFPAVHCSARGKAELVSKMMCSLEHSPSSQPFNSLVGNFWLP